MYINKYKYVYVCKYVCMYVFMHVYMYVYMYAYIYVYNVCVYIAIFNMKFRLRNGFHSDEPIARGIELLREALGIVRSDAEHLTESRQLLSV